MSKLMKCDSGTVTIYRTPYSTEYELIEGVGPLDLIPKKSLLKMTYMDGTSYTNVLQSIRMDSIEMDIFIMTKDQNLQWISCCGENNLDVERIEYVGEVD